MKESAVFVCVSILLLFIQSCSSTKEIRFEDMTEYEAYSLQFASIDA